MRVIFMGSPEFAIPALARLHQDGHEICAVYTQPPREAGRGKKLRPTPVHIFAEEKGLEVRHPISIKNEIEYQAFSDFNVDVAVVVAYGLLLPEAILNAPKHGCLNIHASLLPRWRGAAPIHRAIMAGDEETGVSIMQMEKGLDTGPVCHEVRFKITPDITTAGLHDKLASLGADAISSTLKQLETGSLDLKQQSEDGITYAAKIDKAEARIDFDQPAEMVQRHIHGLSPFPGAWFELPYEGKLLRIKLLQVKIINAKGVPGEILDNELTIACKRDAIKPVRLQREGKAPVNLDEFLNGHQITSGVVCQK